MGPPHQYLTTPLARFFGARAKRSGDSLYQAGRLSFAKGDAGSFQAMIRQEAVASVEIKRQGDELHTRCTCLEWKSTAVCDHLWASLLEAESRGFLTGDNGHSPTTLRRLPGSGGWTAVPATLHAPWRRGLATVRSARQAAAFERTPPPEPARETELWLIADPTDGGPLEIRLEARERLASGAWGKLKPPRLPRRALAQIEGAFGEILRGAVGLPTPISYAAETVPEGFRLHGLDAGAALRGFCATGRFLIRRDPHQQPEQMERATWDDGPAWRFRIPVTAHGGEWRLHGVLEREGESLPLEEIDAAYPDGVLLKGHTWARLDPAGAWDWLTALRREVEITVPTSDGQEFVAEVMTAAPSTAIEWPPELAFEEIRVAPVPRLKLLGPREFESRQTKPSRGELTFVYGDSVLAPALDGQTIVTDMARRRVVVRDLARETEAATQLTDLGGKRKIAWSGEEHWELSQARLPRIVPLLVARGWQVETQGSLLRRADAFHANLTTGIDWFELEGAARFGAETVQLPELLKALRKGENMVRLSDGTFGVLPEEFTSRYAALLGLATSGGGAVRFQRNQSGVLDVLLSTLPEIRVDEQFAKARAELQGFTGIVPAAQPSGFQGHLRDYQREGLAWMQFLARLGFGGCLADDMGVGKTPQVLALLESRREQGQGPSLVVVPRSLVYNWLEEAARFTPALKVLDQSHAARHTATGDFTRHDVVLMTYGTLLRDIARMQSFTFDWVILDEAQAIKNAASESAKAVRLLKANHRLVMTGTPIENHLGELWSLMEFLNPGMLGANPVLQTAARQTRTVDEDLRRTMARALRPFILRRTKQQVAKELPARIEQTIYCELEGEQRRLYDELRDYYRKLLLGQGGTDWSKQKIVVLEALLRLRQSACHPALVDKKKKDVPSAKLDTLLSRIREVVAEEHKVLVFSQFTSYLALVREALDAEGIGYAYLDGKTKSRQAEVEKFQNEATAPVFLISLKAGGTGLNLTAAEYVFLLDPWWNPAVEAQAIDRAHRIGQASTVFACRLIAKDTVEERVLELQKSKRELAEAIIGEDNRLVGNLTSEDLSLLLS